MITIEMRLVIEQPALIPAKPEARHRIMSATEYQAIIEQGKKREDGFARYLRSRDEGREK